MNKLFELYSKGQTHFKDIVKLSGLTFSATINLFAKSNFEPTYSELVELKSEEIAYSLPKENIFKIPLKNLLMPEKAY